MDQRCHGRSFGLPGFEPPSTVQASAQDLGRFLKAKLGPKQLSALLGHSLGGKVVMELLQQNRQKPPAKQVHFYFEVRSIQINDVRACQESASSCVSLKCSS